MMMTTLSPEHISAIRFASYNATVAGGLHKCGKKGKPVQVLQFRLLGQYPKPIEFFKLHFEEATPSDKNE